MKLKNIKVGLRVQYKGTGSSPERKGAYGTILRGGIVFEDCPHIQWDNAVFNESQCGTYGAEMVDNLRIVKE